MPHTFFSLTYQCAKVCKHGDGTTPSETHYALCHHPTETPRHGGGVRVDTARAPGGFCGPEALRMEFNECHPLRTSYTPLGPGNTDTAPIGPIPLKPAYPIPSSAA